MLRVPLTPPMFLLAALVAGVLLAHGLFWGLGLLLVLVLARSWPILLLALLCFGWGWFHASTLQHASNPLQDHLGQKWQLQGHWDGAVLQLADPAAKVALAPAPHLAPGILTVQGTLNLPDQRRNFGLFDFRAWLKLRGIQNVLSQVRVVHHQPDTGFQSHFVRGLTSGSSPGHAALMVALELGDKQDLKDQQLGEFTLQDAFTRAGVAHFLALSGQHVAILVGLLDRLLLRLGNRRHPILLGLLGFYLLLVGTEPSILRAVLQGAVVLLAIWLGKGKLDLLGTLAFSALVSLMFSPEWLFDVGFKLSYLAVLGLTFAPELARKCPEHWPGWLTLPLAATLCAELTTLPVVASTFGTLPWISPISNLVLGPFMLVLVPAGMLAGLLGPLGGTVNVLLGLVLQVFLGLIGLFAHVAPLPWGQISAAGCLVYFSWLLVGLLWLRNRLTFTHWAGFSLFAVLITFLPAQLMVSNSLTFLDVGQGDSTLIQLGHFTMLIDGGGSPGSTFDVGGRTVVPALRKLGVFHLNLVVATHADTDHIEGLSSVLRQVPTGELWIGHRKSAEPKLAELLQAATERQVPVREVRRGDQLTVGHSVLQVLYPQGPPWSEENNDNSIVLTLVSGKVKAVFLGDLPSSRENLLGVGPVDVLKVAHHGSKHSTSEVFLQELHPKMAIISAGLNNSYGHPHKEVLERLTAAGIPILRTDQLGALRLYWH